MYNIEWVWVSKVCMFSVCVLLYYVMYHYCYLHVLFSHVACIKPEILNKNCVNCVNSGKN